MFSGMAMPEDTPMDREARRRVAQRIIPAPGRVVLLPIDVANKTDSGLYLPGSEEGKTALAEVINLGPSVGKILTTTYLPDGETKVASEQFLVIGQTVLYQLYQPIVYEIDGVSVLVIKQDFIDGVLSEGLDAETPPS
jgi:co-chaperonin GroES (HSP10)